MKIAFTRKRYRALALLLLAVAAFVPAVVIISPRLPRKIDIEPAERRVESADIPRLAARSRNKVLLLGVDGASWNVIDPLREKGRLPAISSLIAAGTEGKLKSLKVSKSPVIWTTILTGCMPEKHGISDFLIEGKGARSYQRKVPALWNIMNAGPTQAFVGFWATWPPEPVNGFMISDYVGMRGDDDDTEEFQRMAERLTYPPGILEQITREGRIRDRYELVREFYEKFTGGPVPEKEAKALFGSWLGAYASIYRQDVTFKDITAYLCTHYHPDVTGVYFQGIDAIQHLFWAYREPEKFKGAPASEVKKRGVIGRLIDSVRRLFRAHREPEEYEGIPADAVRRYGDIIDNYYCQQDKWIGELRSLVDRDTTVIVVSDHGAKAKSLERYREDRNSPWYHLSGDHDEYGVIIMAGPAIKNGYVLRNARVEDITPTILYLMGFPVSDDMDGKVLTRAFTPSYKASHPVYRIARYPKEQQKEQKGIGSLDDNARKRLKALGYIQ